MGDHLEPWPQPELFTDWKGSTQKAFIWADFGTTWENSLSCHLTERGLVWLRPAILRGICWGTEISRVGCSLDPFLSELPQKWFQLLWGTMFSLCLFNYASSSVVAGPTPCPALPVCEELWEEWVCLWEQKRMTGHSAAGPSTSTRSSLASATAAWDEGHVSHIC